MAFVISFLKDYAEYVAAVANWSFEAWSKYNPQATRKSQIEIFKQHCNIDRLPLTLIALTSNGKPVGMCSLRENDGVSSKLTPWLASLYVIPAYRNQQVGKLLIEATKRVARSLAYDRLYLLTFDPNLNDYYLKQGWLFRDKDFLDDHPVSILETTVPSSFSSPSDQWP